MGIDLRLPIGMMFAAFGLILIGYGLATQGAGMYVRHSLGININLWWGFVMLLFGAVMLTLARRKRKRT
jgi:predicted MFS family arabinose efflux permease